MHKGFAFTACLHETITDHAYFETACLRLHPCRKQGERECVCVCVCVWGGGGGGGGGCLIGTQNVHGWEESSFPVVISH